VKGFSEASYQVLWRKYGYQLVDFVVAPKAKVANGSSSNTVGLYKLTDTTLDLPEYDQHAHQKEIDSYAADELVYAEDLEYEAAAFFNSPLEDKIRKYDAVLEKLRKTTKESLTSRKERSLVMSSGCHSDATRSWCANHELRTSVDMAKAARKDPSSKNVDRKG
jgi:hypothetical protein